MYIMYIKKYFIFFKDISILFSAWLSRSYIISKLSQNYFWKEKPFPQIYEPFRIRNYKDKNESMKKYALNK